MKEEYSVDLIDENHQLIIDIENQFHVVKKFAEVFDNKEQKLLINEMEALALKQPTSVIEYDNLIKDLNFIQKKFNAFDKLNIEPIKKTLDLIKKSTALAYEKLTTERIKQLKKEKELEAIQLGIIKKEIKKPVAEVRKTQFNNALEKLKSMIIKYSENKELVSELNEVLSGLTI